MPSIVELLSQIDTAKLTLHLQAANGTVKVDLTKDDSAPAKDGGKLAHAIVRVGNRIQIEKTSFTGWQKQYGRSIGLRAPGLFVAHLTRIVAKTGGTLTEVSTFKTKLSQYCHQCGQYRKKPRSQRWHRCPCGLRPVQRDLYSAFLLAHLEGLSYADIATRLGVSMTSVKRYLAQGYERCFVLALS